MTQEGGSRKFCLEAIFSSREGSTGNSEDSLISNPGSDVLYIRHALQQC